MALLYLPMLAVLWLGIGLWWQHQQPNSWMPLLALGIGGVNLLRWFWRLWSGRRQRLDPPANLEDRPIVAPEFDFSDPPKR